MDGDLTFLETSSLLICTLRGHSSSYSSSSVVATHSNPLDPVSHQCNYFLNVMDRTKEVAKQIIEVSNKSSKQRGVGVVEEECGFPQKLRRQGLTRQRKRPRFSLNRSVSLNEEPIIVKPSLNDTHIAEDPEEYFAAIKRNEIAERELKKLRRETCKDYIKDHAPRTVRQRRPGLTEKRTSLNHFSFVRSEGNDSGPLTSTTSKEYGSPRQDTSLPNISQPEEISISQQCNAIEEEASKAKTGDCLIDMLLTNMKWLDEKEDISFIQEKFKLKPIVVDKIRLPVTPDTSPDSSPVAQTASSHSTNPLDAMKVFQKQLLETNKVVVPNSDYRSSSGGPSLSAANGTVDDNGINDTSGIRLKPPRSPSLRVSNTSIPPRKTGGDKIIPDVHATSIGMKKSSLKRNLKPPRSPSSRVSHSDDSPLQSSIQNQSAQSPLHRETINTNEGEVSQSLNSVDVVDDILTNAGDYIKDKLDEVVHEETEQSESARDQSDTSINSTPTSLKKSSLKCILKPLSSPSSGVSNSSLPLRKTGGELILDSQTTLDAHASYTSGEFCHDVLIDCNGNNSFSKEKSDDSPLKIPIQNQSAQSPLHRETTNTNEGEVSQNLDSVDVVDDIPNNVGDYIKDKLDEVVHEETEQSESARDQSSAAMDTTVLPAGHQESSSILAERHIEIATGVPTQKDHPRLEKEKSKIKSLEKEKSKRMSLAGYGSAFVSGVRRSTRMKFRPLEHWRGERLLFGRLHESLPTIIGVKSSSSGGGLKVKYCVSDEHTKLLPNAALH